MINTTDPRSIVRALGLEDFKNVMSAATKMFDEIRLGFARDPEGIYSGVMYWFHQTDRTYSVYVDWLAYAERNPETGETEKHISFTDFRRSETIGEAEELKKFIDKTKGRKTLSVARPQDN